MVIILSDPGKRTSLDPATIERQSGEDSLGMHVPGKRVLYPSLYARILMIARTLKAPEKSLHGGIGYFCIRFNRFVCKTNTKLPWTLRRYYTRRSM